MSERRVANSSAMRSCWVMVGISHADGPPLPMKNMLENHTKDRPLEVQMLRAAPLNGEDEWEALQREILTIPPEPRSMSPRHRAAGPSPKGSFPATFD